MWEGKGERCLWLKLGLGWHMVGLDWMSFWMHEHMNSNAHGTHWWYTMHINLVLMSNFVRKWNSISSLQALEVL